MRAAVARSRGAAGAGGRVAGQEHTGSTRPGQSRSPHAPSQARPASGPAACSSKRGSPVLVFDIMDTIVLDPFFPIMPGFFGLSMKQLMEVKHPTAWLEFERGEIDEAQLLGKFFKDGREVDGEGLVRAVVSEYAYLPGMEALLLRLKSAGYQLHAMSNYPVWYRNIERKLSLSRYLDWTFVSCEGPMQGLRKPSPDSYSCVLQTLQMPPQEIIFIDDRQVNVDAAKSAGMEALRFSGAQELEQQLRVRQLEF